jgi:hypothetical protein
MKKFAAGLSAAVLMGTGFAALSVESASAAPYPGSVKTNCHAWKTGQAVKGGSVTVVYSVGTSGNGEAGGTVTVSIEKRNKKDSASASQAYTGPGDDTLALPLAKGGRYTGEMSFNAPASSVFRDCSTSFDFRVERN